ncbi:MAG: hypothetical protein CMB94_02880 [Flammeovirgaceae bacterium]|nr:hypothetical protein [Flammeovirgaceae bacterium]|tara:strand:- start:396 stop:1136 length:741 start_codon:yes stop_codon:yes gene_type:complete
MKKFGKYIFETTAIFIGILLSFSVERCTRENQEIEETKKSVLTLVKEINNNILYCENHLSQLENMKKINLIITENISENLKKEKLIELHDKYPFGHSYDINGNLIYWNSKENYDNIYQWMITWWNTFVLEDIYFRSLVNSGNLVLIDDYDVSREIEAVYTTRKERVVINLKLLKENSDKIRTWAEEKRNNSDEMISREYIYNNLQDLRLKNLLSDRNYHIGLRVMSMENYIKSLKNLRSLIDSKYK